MLFKRFFFLSFCAIFIFSTHTSAQKVKRLGSYSVFEDMIYQKKQQDILSYIAHDCTRGRATGSLANALIGEYIKDKFIEYGVDPYEGHHYQPFFVDSLLRARNVIGIIPSIIPSDEYIIISAHYDHIGALNGFVYNGADDNASGVTALLNLAEIFATMQKARLGPSKNIIFASFDAKERSMQGSRHFIETLNIPKEKIICNINMDQIGCTLEPVHEGVPEYIVILGEQSLAEKDRGKLGMCNTFYDLDLDIDYTFYGSETFTDLFYKLSDQVAFTEAGIPALLMTSGFHKHSYKITDDETIICYPTLKKRTLLVFYFVMML